MSRSFSDSLSSFRNKISDISNQPATFLALKYFVQSNTATRPISNQPLNNSTSDHETSPDAEKQGLGDTNANPLADQQQSTGKMNIAELKKY